MVRSRSGFFWLPAIPVVAALIATALFLIQDGFGAGHGRFDTTLGILALPGILIVDYIPLPHSVPDIILVILLPAVFNILLWFGLVFILRLLLRGPSAI